MPNRVRWSAAALPALGCVIGAAALLGASQAGRGGRADVRAQAATFVGARSPTGIPTAASSAPIPAAVPGSATRHIDVAPAASAEPSTIGAVGPGTVQTIELPSADAPDDRRVVWIYRPGVADSANLPVLYFLHGLPGSSTDLANTGIAADLDAAFTSGRLAPFVVAAPDGNSTAAADPEWATSADGSVTIESFVTTTLITAVEGANRRDRAHRAIAGFSMGGYGAMNIALRHPDLYGQVVAMAGYFHPDDTSGIFDGDRTIQAANSPDQHITAAAGLRVMLADGQDDTEPVVEGETERFAALLQGAGQQPVVLFAPGGHDWTFVTSVLPDVEAFLEAGWRTIPAPLLPRSLRQ